LLREAVGQVCCVVVVCVVVGQDGYVDVHQGIDRVLEETRDYEDRGKTVSRFGKGCAREREGWGIVCDVYVCLVSI
jgi:hypothetical protein